MEVNTFRINYRTGDTFRLKPILDPHIGATAADVPAFKKYLADSDKKTYFMGFGDLLDSIIWTDKRYAKSDDDTGKNTNEIIDEQVDRVYGLLEPYRRQIIGLGIGNHEYKVVVKNGTNPIKRLCRRLDVKYLGYSGLLRIIFSDNGGRGRTVIIRYHHGYGGGSRTQGATLTKYEKDSKHWVADIFIYGHDHQCKIDRIPRLAISGKDKVIAKPMWLCVGGTYLKTYNIGGDPTYSERAGYPPTHIGGVCIEATPQSMGHVKISAYLS